MAEEQIKEYEKELLKWRALQVQAANEIVTSSSIEECKSDDNEPSEKTAVTKTEETGTKETEKGKSDETMGMETAAATTNSTTDKAKSADKTEEDSGTDLGVRTSRPKIGYHTYCLRTLFYVMLLNPNNDM